MKGQNDLPENRRYGEREVVLRNDYGDELHGVMFAWFPVDEPPMIEVASVDRRWYHEVWVRRGWSVS